MYAEVARPLYTLLVVFEWTEECKQAFQKLKKALVSAPILKAPNWDQIFHVHIDASAFAMGCILAQPGENYMDFPISYASRQLNSAEKNYSTTEREGLAMVYAVKKFRHYLLANKFIFFVNHHALLYLVNKPCATGRIIRWFVILLEFDFTVAVKPGRSHQRADHLSRITSGEAPTGVDDDLPDAALFLVEIAPRWSKRILEVLSIDAQWQENDMPTSIALLEESTHYSLLSRRLYRQGSDHVLWLCPEVDECKDAIQEAHEGLCGFHASEEQTVQRILLNGFWWPTLYSDVIEYVQNCLKCKDDSPVPYATLYSITPLPRWSSYIVEYLKKGHTDPDKPKHRKMLIEVEAQNYTMIEDQLYQRGKDGNLRLCVLETQYLEILHHAHAGIAGGHFFGPTTAKIILWSGLWWPTLHMDAQEYAKRCEHCQRTKPPVAKDEMPLRPILATRAFAKWGIDFVGPIKPPA